MSDSSDPMDCSLPGSIHGIFQTGVLEWGAIAFSTTKILKFKINFFYMLNGILGRIRRRQWHPTPVLLPGKSHGQRAWWAAVHGVTERGTRLSVFTFTFMYWRRKWQPTPVFLPGESQGWRSLVGCCLWGHTESDTTEVT